MDKANFDLSQFYGSDVQYRYKLPMTPELRMSEGVEYFAKEAGAFWFLDIVATEILPMAKKAGEYFVCIGLAVTRKQSAWIVATDGNDNDLYTKAIEYTDLPPNPNGKEPVRAYKFFLIDGVLILPSEY
jgi:hypothetical protein